jgi:hypothetical protein
LTNKKCLAFRISILGLILAISVDLTFLPNPGTKIVSAGTLITGVVWLTDFTVRSAGVGVLRTTGTGGALTGLVETLAPGTFTPIEFKAVSTDVGALNTGAGALKTTGATGALTAGAILRALSIAALKTGDTEAGAVFLTVGGDILSDFKAISTDVGALNTGAGALKTTGATGALTTAGGALKVGVGGVRLLLVNVGLGIKILSELF